MAILNRVWYAAAGVNIDLAFFDDETSSTLAKITVAGRAGVADILSLDISNISAGVFGFGYAAPGQWVASILDQDTGNLRFLTQGGAPVDFAATLGNTFSLFPQVLSSRESSGTAYLYRADGTTATGTTSTGNLLLFPGIEAPQGAYVYAPNYSHTLRRTGGTSIEYRDDTGAVSTLDAAGATFVGFALAEAAYTYAPPYLYAVDNTYDEFDPAVQTVTVYRNLVDIGGGAVTLDATLTGRLRGADSLPAAATPFKVVYFG